MGALDHVPTRKGYRLNEEGEQAYNGWLDDYHDNGGCTCFRSAPCRICYHEGHPYGVEETDEYWEWDDNLFGWQTGFNDVIESWFEKGWTIDELIKEGLIWYKEEKDVSRDKIVDKSKELTPAEKFGLKVGSKIKVTAPAKGCLFHKDDIIVLTKDDGDNLPYFQILSGNYTDIFDLTRHGWEHYTEEEVKPSQVEFKAGDKVKIKKTSEYYNSNDGNPTCEGVILKTNLEGARLPIRVKWDNDAQNGYRSKDLELVNTVITGTIQKGINGEWNDGIHPSPLAYVKVTEHLSETIFKQTKEETNMSNTNRKTVVVNLIDRDSALDEKYALVGNFGVFTTSKNPESLIRSIIMDPANKVAELIVKHNEVRATQVNKELLNRTGNKVMLEPIEESDLYWEIQ